MATILLVAGFLLATAFGPGFLLRSGDASNNQPENALGYLLVTVSLFDPFNGPTPLAGVTVGVSQLILQGVRLSFVTNENGLIEVPLPPGQYGVGVTDVRFTLETQAPVAGGNVTHLTVSVNRTQFYAEFADLSDSTGSRTVNTWETMELAIVSGGVEGRYPFTGFSGTITVSPSQGTNFLFWSNSAFPSNFGRQVFVQSMNLVNGGLGITPGEEVQASVLSQTNKGVEVWLDLQPLKPFSLESAIAVYVINYVPGYSVSFSHVGI
jgi:hypothetical protein